MKNTTVFEVYNLIKIKNENVKISFFFLKYFVSDVLSQTIAFTLK